MSHFFKPMKGIAAAPLRTEFGTQLFLRALYPYRVFEVFIFLGIFRACSVRSLNSFFTYAFLLFVFHVSEFRLNLLFPFVF